MLKKLLKQGPRVINIGLQSFFDALKQQETRAVHVDWRPPIVRGVLLDKLRKLRKGTAK